MYRLGDILKKKLENNKKEKAQATYHQDIAVKIAESFNDMKSIGMYMNICKRYGAGLVKAEWEYIMSRKDIKNPVGYFLSLFKQRGKN